MIRCESVQEAVSNAVARLGKKIFTYSPIAVGSGDASLNELAEYARRGEIDLSVLAAISFEKPRRSDPEPSDPYAAILRRLNSECTDFGYLSECAEAIRHGGPIPRYLTYHSYYYMPGMSRRFPGIQTSYLCSNFRDVNGCIAARGLNLVVMKATRRGNRYSCGTNADITVRAIHDTKKAGGLVVVQENEAMPFTFGKNEIPEASIDYVVKCDEPLFIMPQQPLTELEHAIGSYAAQIIDDGATLQVGIGQIADALAFWLAKKGRTGLSGYSELMFPVFQYLAKNGVITRRGQNGALVTGGFAMGGEDLYRYLDGNPDVFMTEVHETNNRDFIVRLPKFHSVNTTLQMDLFSQSSSEGFFADGRYVQFSGMGGQFEFQESAMKSDGGKSILCLRSCWRDADGKPHASNIVPVLRNVIGVPRNKMDYVVTEYGWRCFRNGSIEERARGMIELADARYQDELLAAARSMGLVESGYTIPAEFRENTYESVAARFGDAARNHRLPLGTGFDLARYATEEERAILADRYGIGG